MPEATVTALTIGLKGGGLRFEAGRAHQHPNGVDALHTFLSLYACLSSSS